MQPVIGHAQIKAGVVELQCGHVGFDELDRVVRLHSTRLFARPLEHVRRYVGRDVSHRLAGTQDAKGEAAAGLPIAMTRVYLSQAMEKVESAAKKIIAAVADGDTMRTQLAILRRLAKYEPFNTIELRQQIAQKTIERGKYTLA